MSVASTVYDVRVVYKVDDKASKPLSNIAQTASSADKWISRVAIGFATGLGMRAGYSALIKYNQGLEQARNQLATIFMGTEGGTWDRATGKATTLMMQFRQDAKQTAGTMKDLVDFASAIANPVKQAGGGMIELREITKGAVVAAAALGVRADVAQYDIQQSLMSGVTLRDRFARTLLSMQGVRDADFNAMGMKDKLKVLTKALKDPAIVAAAKQYENSFEGVTSSLKDNLQIIAGEIGLPLFRAITKEVKSWTLWIDRNPHKIKEFVTTFSNGLIKGFEMVKSIAGFLLEHKTLLMALAKAWLVGKGVSAITKGIYGAASAIKGIGDAAGGGLVGLASKAGSAAAALGGVAAAAIAFAGFIDERQDKGIDKDVDRAATGRQIEIALADPKRRQFLYEEFKRRGLLRDDPRGGINYDFRKGPLQFGSGPAGMAGGYVIGETDDKITYVSFENLRKILLEGQQANAQMIGNQLMQLWTNRGALIDRIAEGMNKANQLKPKKTQPKIDKLVINVSSDDPDRFVMGIQGYMRDWVQNGVAPTGMRST